MKFIATSDWHIGNMFHGNDRLSEHKHFLKWLKTQIDEHKPEALLIAGDVFDYANPSASAQELYYEFIDNVTKTNPNLRIIIIAGNHDSPLRLEAPKALLTRHHVEVRGQVNRKWINNEDGSGWDVDYEGLMIPFNELGERVVVVAVPYLRNDIVQNSNYSEGVNKFLRELTKRVREKYPEYKMIMMTHMYAKGSEIATKDASEKITIGGLEEVNLNEWNDHPEYLVSGHIHKRQNIGNTNWARYPGSVLPMSFAETNYKHGVDLVTITEKAYPKVEFLEYTPCHELVVLPYDEELATPKKLMKIIEEELPDRGEDGMLDEKFLYLALKIKLDEVKEEDLKEIESKLIKKNVVLCKIQKVIPTINLTTLTGEKKIESIEDILNRNPLDTLKETFTVVHNKEMSENQEQILKLLLEDLDKENV